MKQFSTYADVLEHIRLTYSNSMALNYLDSHGKWLSESSQSFVEKVRCVALALVQRGLQRGDRIGIMAKPCPGWTIADYAIVIAGGITVPLFGNVSPENLLYEVEQTGVKTLFVEGEAEWIKLNKHRDLFDLVISFADHSPDEKAILMSHLLADGKAFDALNPQYYNDLLQQAHPDSVASIIYTSGSTGKPKGVQQTQSNLVSMIHQDPFRWDVLHDRYLSFLPLAHIFARCLNNIMVAHGVSIYYLEDPRSLIQFTHYVKPTILVLVPRLLEKLRNKIINRIRDSGYILSHVGAWALRLAESKSTSKWTYIQRWFADKLIYKAFRKALGGNVRVIISGGAKLNAHLNQFFLNMGFPIYEGWGMTEGCPLTCNNTEHRKVGTVGPALDQVEITVKQDGELLVRAPNVMKGYYKDPHATSQVLDAEGWLHTGDQGVVDSEGFVTIKGRIKELFKTSTGEWVAPVPIEHELEKLSVVDHALVIAEERPFCTALLFPDFEVLHGIKEDLGMTELSDPDFLNSSRVRELVLAHIHEMNHHVNHWEEVHDYRFVLTSLTVENGDLTPTLKVRRSVVTQKFQKLIDSMYQREVKL